MFFPDFYVLQHFVAKLHIFSRSGNIDVLCSTNNYSLYPFVSHHGAYSEPAGTGAALLDGSRIDPVFTGQSDSSHLGVRLLQLLFNKFCSFTCAFTPQMRGITYFYFVIVYPHINQIWGLATKDDFVITGIL